MTELTDLKYAILPWMEQITAGHIVSVAALILAAWCIFEAIFRRHNNSMRRGTMALISNTIWPLLVNLCIFCVAYWQWAFALSAVVGLIFISVIRHELKEAHVDELEGRRGLNPLIRTVRAEIFNDLSIEEQMEFKKSVKPQKFYWWIFLPLVMILPFLTILLLERLGVGDYLFKVVYYVTT